MRTVEHWIAGGTTSGSSSRTAPVWMPATGKQKTTVVLANAEDVDNAVAAARGAFVGWSETPLNRRTEMLFAFREIVNARAHELAELISDEHGKVLSDARAEVARGLEVVEFACGIPHLMKGEYSGQVSSGVDAFSFREPLGVCVGITPFNFPIMVPMWMHPIAIATGNTFILKPSERDPSVSIVVAEMYAEAGLPAGVFNVVNGDKEAVDVLLRHPDVAAISFVGSTPVARHIYHEGTVAGKRVQALGGAKNHAIVMPDADINFASDHIVSAAFGSAGERCMAISATIGVGAAGAALVEALTAKSQDVRVGPGRKPGIDMGPVVTPEARDRIIGLIAAGEQEGATLRVDGRAITIPGYEDGFYVGPTVFDDVRTDMRVYRHEIFGPVLSVLRAETLDDAIGIINSNPYGNGTAIFTSNGNTARRFQRAVQVGMIGINVPVPVPMSYYSFGGWKDSMFGDQHVHGSEGVSFYTRWKVVTSRWLDGRRSSGASYDMPSGGGE